MEEREDVWRGRRWRGIRGEKPRGLELTIYLPVWYICLTTCPK